MSSPLVFWNKAIHTFRGEKLGNVFHPGRDERQRGPEVQGRNLASSSKLITRLLGAFSFVFSPYWYSDPFFIRDIEKLDNRGRLGSVEELP